MPKVFVAEIHSLAQALADRPADLDLHRKLRAAGLRRKAAGGKAGGWLDSWRARRTKEPLAAMIEWEVLLARDPGNTDLMLKVMIAADGLELSDVVEWIHNLIVKAQL